MYTRDSSNLQYVTTVTMALLIHSKTISAAQSGEVQCGSAKFSATQIRAFAKSQVPPFSLVVYVKKGKEIG